MEQHEINQPKTECVQEVNFKQMNVEACSCIPLMLPEDFRVYTDGDLILNHPFPGGEEKILPTYNHYTGKGGGYVAIYTKEKESGVYSVGNGIYVVGQVRVEGNYDGRIFLPTGYSLGDDITQDPAIIKICEQYFPKMAGKMWIGGDTGGWFGIQSN